MMEEFFQELCSLLNSCKILIYFEPLYFPIEIYGLQLKKPCRLKAKKRIMSWRGQQQWSNHGSHEFYFGTQKSSSSAPKSKNAIPLFPRCSFSQYAETNRLLESLYEHSVDDVDILLNMCHTYVLLLMLNSVDICT